MPTAKKSFNGSTSNQPSSKQIQRGLRSAPTNELAIAWNDQLAMFGACVVGEGDINKPHRFFFAPSTWPRDASYCQPKIRACAFANSLGHCFGHWRTHSAIFKQ